MSSPDGAIPADTPPPDRREPRVLGGQAEQIRQDLLDIDPAEIAELRAKGGIWACPAVELFRLRDFEMDRLAGGREHVDQHVV